MHTIPPVDAVILDLDGVLIDSEPLWRQAEIAVFAAAGLEITDADCAQTQGLRIDAVVAYWRARHPLRGDSTTLVDAIITRVEQLIGEQGCALPGAVAAVRSLQQQGWPLAVASASSQRLITAALSRLQLSDCFTVQQSAEHQPYGKPHPAVYLAAARTLGVDPERCLAIEDSINGMVAAKAASMIVAVVPEAGLRQRPQWSLADYRLETLTELPVILSGQQP